MQHPRVIARHDPKTQLLEHAPHGFRIFTQAIHTTEGHRSTVERAHQQPTDGMAFRSREGPFDVLWFTQSPDGEHLEVVGNVTGFGR